MRLAIEQGREELVVIKNYRKNGSSYWSRVQIAPIRDSNDRITLIVSVQYEVRNYHKYSINMKYQITQSVEYEKKWKASHWFQCYENYAKLVFLGKYYCHSYFYFVILLWKVPGPMTGEFLTAISDDMTGSHISNDDTFNDGSTSGSGSLTSSSSSSDGSLSSKSRSCASFADDRSGSCNGSTSGGGNTSSGYSSNDNRSSDGVSDQGDIN